MSAQPLHGAAAPASALESESSSLKALFFVSAVSDPGLLPRLVEPFSKLGLVPDRVHADREAHADRLLNVDLRIADVTPRYAHLLDKALRSVVGVRSVITVRE